MQKTFKEHWPSILAGIMLLLAIPTIWPYGYFQLLRWVVAIVACYNVYKAHGSNQTNWMVIMIGIAIIFNPIAPIHFEKETWSILDAVTGVIMLLSIKKINN